jgi:four helix bundle protein
LKTGSGFRVQSSEFRVQGSSLHRFRFDFLGTNIQRRRIQMATFKRFEDIEAWKKARELTREIYRHSKAGLFSKDFALRDQIRRAAVSVMSNIAEGFERGGTKEFMQFLAIAKGSVGEIEAQLYVGLDQAYINEAEFLSLSLERLAEPTKRLIGGLMSYLRQSGMKGPKYK